MKPIKILAGVNPKYISENTYGVEIEVEGSRLPEPGEVAGMWRVERDSSLKTAEAWEYVLKYPTTLKGVKQALDALDDAYKSKKSKVHDSVRAGVHIHMNVQEWNISQLMTFATVYYLLEDQLLKWCGENREGNLFCLRTKDAEYVLFQIMRALQERNLKYLQNDVIRYSSLNFCSLFKYGTVEFRGMRGTPDLSLVYIWAQIIDELRTSSLKYSSPADVLNQFSGDGETQFIRNILPNFHNLIECKDQDKLVRNAARRVQMIAFGIDWKDVMRDPINPFPVANKAGL